MEQTLLDNPDLAALIVKLFTTRFDPGFTGDRDAAAKGILADFQAGLDAVSNADQDRILRRFLNLVESTLRTNFYQPGADGEPKSYVSFKIDSQQGRGIAPAAAAGRGLGLFAAHRMRAPARRSGCPRRHPLVGPARGLPHRDPRPDEGADGQERGDCAGRLQGRLRVETAAARRRPRGVPGRGHRMLQDPDARPARCHRQPRRFRSRPAASRDAPRRRRSLSGGRRRQGHRYLLRHRQRRLRRLRLLARRCLRLRGQSRL